MQKDVDYDSYTSAELRFILRYFDQMSDVFFYYNGQLVSITAWLEKFKALDLFVKYLHSKQAFSALACLEKQDITHLSTTAFDGPSLIILEQTLAPPPIPKKQAKREDAAPTSQDAADGILKTKRILGF